MSFKRSVFGAVGLLCIVGCHSDVLDNPPVNLTVRNDKPVYSLAADQFARAVLINRGPATVYLRVTGEYVVAEKFRGGLWRDPRAYFTTDGIGISVPIAPGDSINGYDMDFAYVDNAPGTYRFRFFVFEDPDTRNLVPASKSAGPAFELRP